MPLAPGGPLVVKGGLEGVLPAEALFCLASLLGMQRPSPAVLVKLTQGAGLQHQSATAV